MDYMQFVDYHRSSGADITIGCIAYDESRASDFGLMKVRQGHPYASQHRAGWALKHIMSRSMGHLQQPF